MNRDEKEILLKLLLEKYEDGDDDDCEDISLDHLPPMPPEEFQMQNVRNPISLKLLTLCGVEAVDVRVSNWQNIFVTVRGGDVWEIAKVLADVKPVGMPYVNGNVSITIPLDCEWSIEVKFQYIPSHKRCCL